MGINFELQQYMYFQDCEISKVDSGPRWLGANPPNPARHQSISISIGSLPHICIGNATKFVRLEAVLRHTYFLLSLKKNSYA